MTELKLLFLFLGVCCMGVGLGSLLESIIYRTSKKRDNLCLTCKYINCCNPNESKFINVEDNGDVYRCFLYEQKSPDSKND